MLQDIDLKYVGGVLTTTKPLAVPSLTVAGSSVAAPASAQPSDHGLTAWASDPAMAGTSSSLVNGTLYLMSVFLRQTATVSKCWWINTAAAVTPTAGQSLVGIYNLAGTLLSSASIDSPVAANGPQSATLAASQSLAAGRYWVGMLVNAATPPQVARMTGASASGNNINLSAANYRICVNGTGLTAMPSSITPSSNSLTSTIAAWVGLS